MFATMPEVIVVDYTEDAAPANYEEYTSNLAVHSEQEIEYRAVYLYGPAEIINPYTQSLSRLS